MYLLHFRRFLIAAQLVSLAVLLHVCALPALAQLPPNIENGTKSFGSYQGGNVDAVNLQNGNLMFHAPLFAYPQRGGKLGLSYAFLNGSKNWQVEEYIDSHLNSHLKWVLAQPAAVYIANDQGIGVQRFRIVQTDTVGNQSFNAGGYAVTTPDGAIHWLTGTLANGNKVTVDGSDFQYTLTSSGSLDGSFDSATVTDREGTRYYFPNISHPTTPAGNSTPVGWPFTDQRAVDGSNTTDTINDRGRADSIIDANGNSLSSPFVSGGLLQYGYMILGNDVTFAGGTPTATSDYSGCVTPHAISQAMLVPFPGPDGRSSTVKVCGSTFMPAASFSQSGVEAPTPDPPLFSYSSTGYTYLVSAVMPDGSYWSFDYDGYGNITSVRLPTGGTITYQWTEITLPSCPGNPTRVSRAVESRTVNDLVNPPQIWHYIWGQQQGDGSITNYVLDPNGNETAHVFTAPIANVPCALYETETRAYQGTHDSGTPLKTVDTHYTGNFDFTDVPGNTTLNFAANVVADTVTTTLPGNRISQVVREYDAGPPSSVGLKTFGKVTDEKVYDNGALLRETATTYQWQVNSAYLNAGLIGLPASVIVKDGNGCKMAETDYFYDESSYPNVNYETTVGTLPSGTHQAVSTPRGNLTTVTRKLFDHSECTPTAESAISSHTRWYDTGEPYQQTDPLGHTTTLSYDLAYAGAFLTQTCSPATNGVAHCVSGTYDAVTGLLENFTNENATGQASGNTPGDPNHTSTYSYDTSWRLTLGQAPPDPANDNARAHTIFNFGNAYPLSIQRQKSITGMMDDLSTNYFDGVGRANHSEHATPSGPSIVMTTYDGLGQATSVTNPYFTTSDPTYGVTYSQYDGLGRVTQTAPPDGTQPTPGSTCLANNICTSYSGNAVTVTDQAGHQRRTISDALGRLVEVDEPNPGAPPVAAGHADPQRRARKPHHQRQSSHRRRRNHQYLEQRSQRCGPARGRSQRALSASAPHLPADL